MAEVYRNVNVNYSYCKSVAQLKSAADYILGKKKEQIKEGIQKTRAELYGAFGCNRDNFANSLLITRKMHDKKYSRYKQKDILARKMSISFHPEDNDKLNYKEADKIAREFAHNTLEDVVEMLKKIYLMDIRLKGNTISYALPYHANKAGRAQAVRGSKLGNRFTVAGIRQYMQEKEQKQVEYRRTMQDVEEAKQYLDDYEEWREEKENIQKKRRGRER